MTMVKVFIVLFCSSCKSLGVQALASFLPCKLFQGIYVAVKMHQINVIASVLGSDICTKKLTFNFQ